MGQSLQSLIIQVDVAQLNILTLKGFHVHTKTMVLRSDLHSSCLEVLHRLIRTPVAELELESLPS